ncbi:glycosyltransferase family 1 protein [Heliobacterium chlorum]|uniref:Glycosyltransferase family 1 protein n=1 Tax=Heliobacterium chlorum TaxID=2698 RepID=A0ABR7T4Y0_HELCL|nr:glycosyltransferase family 1 protein [Heliobacterium chlorum]MBC9785834.1 glycosyltransferase family 1 protein [Heliobacterium chlorum]
MSPIRVLQVLASLNRGGAETMIMNVYRQINRRQIQFDFIVNENKDPYDYEKEVRELGGRIYPAPRFTITNYLPYKRYWEQLLMTHPEWRIIHGHHTSPALIYLNAAKSMNRVTIAHSHTAGGEKSLKSMMKVILRYPLRYIADHLLACSTSAAKWMFGKRGDSAQIIKNAIDINKFIFNEIVRNEKRREFQIEEHFVIGHVGRFQIPKNHQFLIRIFKIITERKKDVRLMLVGDGELRPAIEHKVNELGLADKVIFTGSRSDIPELLQAMDLFVFPSRFEGLGLAVVEAQAAGLPCIVANTIPTEAYVTDQIEEVAIDASADIWAESIIRHCKGNERKSSTEQIKASGFAIEETVNQLTNFYMEQYKLFNS